LTSSLDKIIISSLPSVDNLSLKPFVVDSTPTGFSLVDASLLSKSTFSSFFFFFFFFFFFSFLAFICSPALST